jgi:glutamate N-acetyltransferase / amino-acid N-acetyltransferase
MSVTSPRGFVASGVACGIKSSGALDLALVCTEDHKAVPVAAVFTSNKAKAAPVLVSREHLEVTTGRAAAVILSSGNANAQTGAEGKSAAAEMCELVASGIGSSPEEVLVCQTGLIGVRFPIDRVKGSIPDLVGALGSSDDDGDLAATAIMTTDTVDKQVLVTAEGFTVGGMAKGAAMLHPNMATMLAVLTTDAQCEPEVLERALEQAVSRSFNEMTVDGSCSTNDTVIVLANGAAGPAGEVELTAALSQACAVLAEAMVKDAEGATRVACVTVTGAASSADARLGARKVANWGRVVSELGSAGIDFDPDSVAVSYGGVTVCESGIAVPHDAVALAKHMEGDRVEITCDLGLGSGKGSVLTCDLGYGYIDENRTTS